MDAIVNPLQAFQTNIKTTPDDYKSYDYCMVVRAENEDFNEKGRKIVRKIAAQGFRLKCFLSAQRDEILVLIGAEDEKIGAFADLINYKMLLDSTSLEQYAKRGDPERGVAPIDIAHEPHITPLTPYENIYGKYDTDESLQALYYRPEGAQSPFVGGARLKLLSLMLQAPKSEGGCNLALRKMVVKKDILAFYPLHTEMRDQLAKQLLVPLFAPWELPLWDIREYFGEKIALYFCFLSHYTTWCVVPAIVGLGVQIHVAATVDTSAPSVPFFGLFIALWAILMLEYWKRKQKTMAMEWGMIGFEQEQKDRPEFYGETMKSYIDGKEVLYFPDWQRASLICQSFSVIAVMIFVVIGAVAGIYAFRENVHWDNESIGSLVASILSAVQIQILNAVYGFLADKLTDRENHRTDTQYEDSLIAKLFLFQFVNSFASFFYIAFVQPYRSPEVPDPMNNLALNLTIIFGTKLVVGNIMELVVPTVLARRRLDKETNGTEGVLTAPELEYVLQPYDIIKDAIKDYAELAIQYGYLTLFVTAFPAAPLLALISNYIEILVDSRKLLYVHQRPIPTGVEDIGTWQAIFSLVSVGSVISNSALVCFTMTVFDDEDMLHRVWLFICFQYFVIGLMYIFSALIPDEPEEVEIQHQRQEFLVAKIICKVADENDADLLQQLGGATAEEDVRVEILPSL